MADLSPRADPARSVLATSANGDRHAVSNISSPGSDVHQIGVAMAVPATDSTDGVLAQTEHRTRADSFSDTLSHSDASNTPRTLITTPRASGSFDFSSLLCFSSPAPLEAPQRPRRNSERQGSERGSQKELIAAIERHLNGREDRISDWNNRQQAALAQVSSQLQQMQQELQLEFTSLRAEQSSTASSVQSDMARVLADVDQCSESIKLRVQAQQQNQNDRNEAIHYFLQVSFSANPVSSSCTSHAVRSLACRHFMKSLVSPRPLSHLVR